MQYPLFRLFVDTFVTELIALPRFYFCFNRLIDTLIVLCVVSVIRDSYGALRGKDDRSVPHSRYDSVAGEYG